LEPFADKIREMILSNNAGPENLFEVILILVDSKGTRPDKAVISPRKISEGDNVSYVFHINHIMYHYNISDNNKLSLFEKGIIRNDGIMDIVILSEELSRWYFDGFLGKTLLMRSNIKV